ncbi:MAG: transcriptional regulator, partial [Saccharothrix sp.]|nr:transcriptional regulator [Saccharothrix sp.]
MTTSALPDTLTRPRLDHLLAAARSTRLTTVVAPAGYGKTTFLAGWADRAPVAWHTVTERDRFVQPLLAGLTADLRAALPALDFAPPDVLVDDEATGSAGRTNRAHAMAAALFDAVTAAATGDPVLLVLDDLHVLHRDDPAAELLAALCLQAPPALRVVLAGREPTPFPVRRLRARGELLEVTAAQLAFTETETARLLPGVDRARVAEVHRTTGGWPVAVRMAADALRRDPDSPAAVELPRNRTLYDCLAHEVFDREPPRVRALLAAAALFDRFDAELMSALGFADAAAVLADLVARGLFVERLPAAPGRLGLIPLARAFLESRFPVERAERDRLGRAAAEWFAEHGQLPEALAVLTATADHRGVARLLARRGDELVQQGGADSVVAAVDRIPPADRDPTTWQLA